MKKLLNKIKNAALYTWQLPQNLLGLALYYCYKGYEVCTKETCGECIKCKLSSNMRSGITLGNYIIVNNIKHLDHGYGYYRGLYQMFSVSDDDPYLHSLNDKQSN